MPLSRTWMFYLLALLLFLYAVTGVDVEVIFTDAFKHLLIPGPKMRIKVSLPKTCITIYV